MRRWWLHGPRRLGGSLSFARWHILRPLRARPPQSAITESTDYSARARLKCVAAFLDWLAHRGHCLGEVQQLDVDTWCARQPPHRIKLVHAFTAWASTCKAMPPLDVPAGRTREPVAPIRHDERWAVARRLLHAPEVSVADRVAGALVIVYAQPLTRVNRLTVSDLIMQPGRVAIRLGSSPIEIPSP